MWLRIGLSLVLLLWASFAEAATRTTLHSATAALSDGTVATVDDKGAAGVTVTGTFSATLTFEGSADGGTTYTALTCVTLSTLVSTSTTTATGQFLCPVAGLSHFRARISSYTSGTVTAIATVSNATIGGGSSTGFSFDPDGNLLVSLGTCLSGESQCIGASPNSYIQVKPIAGSTNGATTLRYISVGSTEDEHAVCTAPCTLYSVTVTNTNAAARHLKCENDTAAGTAPGTDVPELDLAVPGQTTGAGITFAFPVGANFSTALTCWLVTGAAESDVAEVAANELKVFYTFKQ